ncbi:MAG: hypothetical protein KDB61_16235, partial [Planctomycetes bacterium]|nr:hypothetical protein [Planctomycetota bacterium]
NVPPSKAARANAINHRVTEYYAVSGAAEARVAIANGNPVAFAFVTYNNFHDERVRTTGMFPVPVGKMRGAHQVVAKGYDDTKVVPGWPAGAFLVKNWWGDWGIPHPVFASTAKVGYWWYPYAAFNDPQQTFGCWTIHGVPLLESI